MESSRALRASTVESACQMQQTLQKTLQSRTIFCRDNLEVLRGINSESIDLVYLDPPFNKGQHFHATRGTTAEGAGFKDIWREEDTKDEWHGLIAKEHPVLYRYLSGIEQVGDRSNKYYLIYMAVRLLELHRVLKPTGALYLHGDSAMSHYLKLLMDAVFGHANFRNEVVWCYTRMASKGQKVLSRAHDTILYYSKTSTYYFDVDSIRLPYAEGSKKREGYALHRLGSGYSKEGKTVLNPIGKFPEDWIVDIPYLRGKERVGYPTQKPRLLLERMVKLSCPAKGVVLDPFCGGGTTCIAAERLGRGWIGIDVSKKAYELVRMRIEKEVPGQSPAESPAESPSELALYDKVIYREDIPQRSDVSDISDASDVFDIREPLQRKEIIKETLFGRQKGYCSGCRESVRVPVAFDYHHLEVDHIVPKSKGGGDSIENLQLLCGHCSKLKGDKDMAYLRTKLKEYKLIP